MMARQVTACAVSLKTGSVEHDADTVSILVS